LYWDKQDELTLNVVDQKEMRNVGGSNTSFDATSCEGSAFICQGLLPDWLADTSPHGARDGYPEIGKLLLDAGADVDARASLAAWTPLHAAAQW